MFRTIIIDDEELAINYLEKMLNKTGEIEVVATYTSGNDALEEVMDIKPEVIFLDINMPDVSGLEIAKKIQEILPDAKIVFVTGYEQYAVEAFELGVTDFIVKPFQIERINHLVNRLNGDRSRYKEVKKDEYMVCCFKYFHFKKNGEEIKNVKWRTAKSKELFIYLVQNHKEIVRKDILIELLWPNLDTDSAYDNLYSTIYHIRKLLQQQNIDIDIVSTVSGYELNFNDIKYDVDEWEKSLNRTIITTVHEYEICRINMEYYTGDYLAEESYVWKENELERLRVVFVAKTKEMIKYLMEEEMYTEATLRALHLQQLYPYMDYPYFMLMQLYDKEEDIYNVEKQYTRLKEMLNNEFNTNPKNEIRNWYKDWLERQVKV